MDLALNNLQRLICHKPNQPTSQPTYLNNERDGWLFEFIAYQLV